MSEGQQAELFCVVANVAEETAHGEGGMELRQGIKHFAAGAKVWVLPPQWGDGGAQVIVAGVIGAIILVLSLVTLVRFITG